MRIYLLFCVFLLCFTACNQDVKTMIDNGGFKYWKVDAFPYCYYYYFDSDGHWTVFESVDSFREYNGGDIILTKRWHLKGDSIINVDAADHRILTITPRKLVWENVSDSDSFVVATKNEIPEKFWKRQQVRP